MALKTNTKKNNHHLVLPVKALWVSPFQTRISFVSAHALQDTKILPDGRWPSFKEELLCCSYQETLGPAFPRAQRWPWDNTPADIQVDPRSRLDSWPGHHVWHMGSSFRFKLKSSSREPSAMKFRCRWLHLSLALTLTPPLQPGCW